MRDAPGKYDSAMLFREDFRDAITVAGHGLVSYGAADTYSGGFIGNASSYLRLKKALNFRGIRTIILDITFTVATAQYFLDMSGNASMFVRVFNAGATTVEVAGFPSSAIYINGVPQTSGLTAGRYRVTIVTNTVIAIGTEMWVGRVSGVSAFTGKLHSLKFFSQNFTADEVLDEYQADTYSEITPDKALVWLPLRSQYHNGSDYVTQNIGSTGTPASLCVTPGTLAEVPAQLSPAGVTMTATKRISGTVTMAGKSWTIGAAIQPTNATATAKVLAHVGAFATAGFRVTQDGTDVSVWWDNAALIMTRTACVKAGQKQTVIVSSNAGSIDVFVDGVKQGASYDASAKTALSGSYAYAFGDASAAMPGALYNPIVMNVGISATQARSLHTQLMRRMP